MAVVKVIEILAESDSSWEDATKNALAEASKSIRNISSIYVKEFTANVENNKITKFRINAKISFKLDDAS